MSITIVHCVQNPLTFQETTTGGTLSSTMPNAAQPDVQPSIAKQQAEGMRKTSSGNGESLRLILFPVGTFW